MKSDIIECKELKRLAEHAYDDDRMVSVIELLERYLEYFPDDGKAWFLFGDAQRVIGRKGSAAVSLGNAESLCPAEHRWSVQSHLGMLFQDTGDCSSAERWFGRALEADEAQQQSWLWILRGCNYAMQELLDEAESCHRRAIAVNKQDEEAYLNLAMVCRAQGKYDQAKSAVETALALCPHYPSATQFLHSLEGAAESRQLVEKVRRSASHG